MKVFLNVVGILAMLCGPAGLFLGKGAVEQALGGLSLLIGCTALGFAKLIEQGESTEEQSAKHRAKELELLRAIANGQNAPSTPTAPAIPRWFVANGEEVTGPFTESQIRALKDKGMLTAESKLAAEGTQDWRPLALAMA